MRICECCGKEFDETLLGKYSTGRFCSKSCANTRKHSKEVRKKISERTKAKLKILGRSRLESEYFIIKKPVHLYTWTWFKCENCGKPILEYTNKKKPHSKFCSEFCKKRYLAELARNQIRHGYGAYGSYKGFRCDSLLELCFLIFCLDHKINIQRCTDCFEYVFEGKKHLYNPDFIVNSRYIEIKGWTSARAEAKIAAVRVSGEQIFVLYSKDLCKCINYVCFKYNVSKTNLKCLYDIKEYTKTCIICGKSFISKNPSQCTCSRHCNGVNNGHRIWISNGFKLKHVMPDQLNAFLSNGWYRVKPLGPNKGFIKLVN